MSKFVDKFVISLFVVLGLVIVGSIAVDASLHVYDSVTEFITTEFNSDVGVQE